jgi:hypothetical protein
LSFSLFETNGYSMPLKTYRAKLVFSFISQCCYFNSQWTPVPAIKKSSSCVKGNTPAGTNTQLQFVDLYKSGLWRGLGGGRCPFWIQTETLTFKGPAA